MANQLINAGSTTFGAPAAGDSFYIQKGGQSITGNTDYSGQNTSVLAEVRNGFTGQIGTATNPWKTAFSTSLWYGAGGGDLYFESNALDTEITALVRHTGGGHLHLLGSTAVITRLDAMGRTSVGNGVTITTLYGGMLGTSIILEDTGTGAAVVTTNLLGAHLYSQRPHTTINGGSGKLVLDCDQASAVNAHGTINLYGPVDCQIWDSGTITTLLALGAIPDLSKLTRALTITNTTINMSLPGASQFLDNGLVTFTNTPVEIFTDGSQI